MQSNFQKFLVKYGDCLVDQLGIEIDNIRCCGDAKLLAAQCAIDESQLTASEKLECTLGLEACRSCCGPEPEVE